MKITFWNKKGWPPLHDLQLEELKDFKLPGNREKILTADPEYLVSYYFTDGFCIVIPTWHGFRRYSEEFMEKLRSFTGTGCVVDDIGILEETPSMDYLFRFGENQIRVPVLKSIRYDNLRARLLGFSGEAKVVDQKMMEVWKGKLFRTTGKKTAVLIPFPGVQNMSAPYSVCSCFVGNIATALQISQDRKFRIYTCRDSVMADAGGFRIIAEATLNSEAI